MEEKLHRLYKCFEGAEAGQVGLNFHLFSACTTISLRAFPLTLLSACFKYCHETKQVLLHFWRHLL